MASGRSPSGRRSRKISFVEKLLGVRVVAPSPSELTAEMIPPRAFDRATFSSYTPQAGYPGQLLAMRKVAEWTRDIEGACQAGRRRSRKSREGRGIYLDGGFGVGKTHLMAAAWRSFEGSKIFASFTDLTYLVGAVGFSSAVEMLRRLKLICIDEFELDDPGDTVMISRLLSEVASAGASLMATSNTLPDRLGEGRFSASDFIREIQQLSSRFEVVVIDGKDYRHRSFPELGMISFTSEEVEDAVRSGFVAISLEALLRQLSMVHPTRYRQAAGQITGLALTGVTAIGSQDQALRLVALVDRLYNQSVPLVFAGDPLPQIFGEAFMHGGFRMKYRRSLSRLYEIAALGRRFIEGNLEGRDASATGKGSDREGAV